MQARMCLMHLTSLPIRLTWRTMDQTPFSMQWKISKSWTIKSLRKVEGDAMPKIGPLFTGRHSTTMAKNSKTRRNTKRRSQLFSRLDSSMWLDVGTLLLWICMLTSQSKWNVQHSMAMVEFLAMVTLAMMLSQAMQNWPLCSKFLSASQQSTK